MASDVKVWPMENKLLCFRVESRSKPQFPREVDLESFKFNGECDCERFEFHCHPSLIRGAFAAEHLRCTHIRAARSFFLDEILPKIFPLIKPICEHQVTQAQQCEGIITAIVTADVNTYQPKQKLADLMGLKAHLDAAVEQVFEEVDSAKNEKYEQVDHPGDDVPYV